MSALLSRTQRVNQTRQDSVMKTNEVEQPIRRKLSINSDMMMCVQYYCSNYWDFSQSGLFSQSIFWINRLIVGIFLYCSERAPLHNPSEQLYSGGARDRSISIDNWEPDITSKGNSRHIFLRWQVPGRLRRGTLHRWNWHLKSCWFVLIGNTFVE